MQDAVSPVNLSSASSKCKLRSHYSPNLIIQHISSV